MYFSIIIPAYNAENYIRKAFDSVRQQSFEDYELIVVCDACTDNTYEVASEYTENVYNVSFHNDGLARNFGLDVAQGRFVLFMDDDDWFLHEFVLDMLNRKLRTYKSKVDVLCFGFIYAHKGYASPISSRFNSNKRWIAVWNKCWKRKAIGKTRFPNIERCSDRYFNKEMFEKSLTIIDWDMPMYYYNYLRVGSQTEKAHRRKLV